jgi:glutathione S-transferase
LAPANGTFERYKLQEWLTFIGTELHKGFSPLFTPGMPEEAKTIAKARLNSRLQWVNGELANKTYLMGDTFTVADGYLFTVVNWSKHVGIDISGLANLGSFMGSVGTRPAVQDALRAEGLIK